MDSVICQPFLTGLSVFHFQSIRETWISFDNPTIFVGKNGAGKSNLVGVISFLGEIATDPLQSVFERHGGIQAVRTRTVTGGARTSITVEANLRLAADPETSATYAFNIHPLADGSFEVVYERGEILQKGGRFVQFNRHFSKFTTLNVSGLQPRMEREALALPIVGGVEEFAPLVTAMARMRVFSLQPARMREMQEPSGSKSLAGDGSNIASVLMRSKRQSDDTLDWMGKFLAGVIPGITGVRPVRRGRKLAIQFTQEAAGGKLIEFDADAMSDGTLRLLGMLTAVMQEPVPSVIAIEEPETSLHPGAIDAVLDLLEIAAERTQVIITTQSPDLLDAKWIRSHNLRLVTWESGATHVAPVGPATVTALQQHLVGAGDLLRAGAIDEGPRPLAAPRAKPSKTSQ